VTKLMSNKDLVLAAAKQPQRRPNHPAVAKALTVYACPKIDQILQVAPQLFG
jgi:hypothetical protein